MKPRLPAIPPRRGTTALPGLSPDQLVTEPSNGEAEMAPASALARRLNLRLIDCLWRRGANTSTNQQIFGAAFVIGAAIFFVKLVAMLKDLVVAAIFGTNFEMDAFLMAFVIPTFVLNLVASSFGAALIPTYIEVRDQQGKPMADEVLSSVTLISLVLLCSIVLLLALVGPHLLPFLASGFDADALALTRNLFYLLLPCTIISGIATLWSTVLNAGERFALAELSQVMLPVGVALAVVVGGQRWGIYSLAVGFVAGCLGQACVVACGLRRQKIPLIPRWRGRNAAVSRVIGQYLPMIGGGILLGSHLMIDQAMAATLAPGSVAALGYGTKVVALVLAVGSMSVGTAVLPYFSRMIAANEWASVRHTLKTFSGLILVTTIPLTVALYLLSGWIIELVFERGAFTATDTEVVARVQAMSALQIPFFVLSILFVRLISSMKANQILMIGTAISFFINLSMNYVLKEVMGVAGIALSTTIVYACSLIFLAVMLHRRMNQMQQLGQQMSGELESTQMDCSRAQGRGD